jgi:hypothetical protein
VWGPLPSASYTYTNRALNFGNACSRMCSICC